MNGSFHDQRGGESDGEVQSTKRWSKHVRERGRSLHFMAIVQSLFALYLVCILQLHEVI